MQFFAFECLPTLMKLDYYYDYEMLFLIPFLPEFSHFYSIVDSNQMPLTKDRILKDFTFIIL